MLNKALQTLPQGPATNSMGQVKTVLSGIQLLSLLDTALTKTGQGEGQKRKSVGLLFCWKALVQSQAES